MHSSILLSRRVIFVNLDGDARFGSWVPQTGSSTTGLYHAFPMFRFRIDSFFDEKYSRFLVTLQDVFISLLRFSTFTY
jgi:hypothetical protein